MPQTTPTKITELIPDDRNANKHSAAGRILLDKGLRQNGAGRSILISADNKIIAGNGVTEAAGDIGIKDVQIIDTDGTKLIAVRRTDINSGTREFYEMALSDNIIAKENIVLDAEMIDAICDDYQITEWRIEDKIFKGKVKDDEFVGGPPAVPITSLGDIYDIGPHRLMCGDSRYRSEVSKLTRGKLLDMVVTDPPYNVDYEGGTGMTLMNDKMQDSEFYNLLLDAFKAFQTETKPGGAWYVWHADSEGLNFRRAFEESGLLLKQCLVWVKSSLVMGRQDYQWKHEPCLYGWKPGAAHYFIDARDITTVIDDKVDYRKMKKPELLKVINDILGDKIKNTVLYHDKPSKSELHPTMKPVLLIAEQIRNSSQIGERVGDAFGGSGTTLISAHQLHRAAYLMELDPRYADVIIARAAKFFMTAGETHKFKRNGKPITEEDLQKYITNTHS